MQNEKLRKQKWQCSQLITVSTALPCHNSQISGGRQLTFSLETGFFRYLFPSFPELAPRMKNRNYSYLWHLTQWCVFFFFSVYLFVDTICLFEGLTHQSFFMDIGLPVIASKGVTACVCSCDFRRNSTMLIRASRQHLSHQETGESMENDTLHEDHFDHFTKLLRRDASTLTFWLI